LPAPAGAALRFARFGLTINEEKTRLVRFGRRNRGRPPAWEQFDGLLRVFPLAPAGIVHSVM